jgi:hypothetical protein
MDYQPASGYAEWGNEISILASVRAHFAKVELFRVAAARLSPSYFQAHSSPTEEDQNGVIYMTHQRCIIGWEHYLLSPTLTQPPPSTENRLQLSPWKVSVNRRLIAQLLSL